MPLPFPQEPLSTIRHRVGALLYGRDQYVRDLVLASPAPTSTTFALDIAKRFGDDRFLGRTAYAVQGTGAGQVRVVSDHVQSTGVLTVTPALATVFDVSTLVELWPESLTPTDVNRAINQAILRAGRLLNVYQEITNPTFGSTRRIVNVPTGLVKVCGVRYFYQDQWVEFTRAPGWLGPVGDVGRQWLLRGSGLYLNEDIPTAVPGVSIVVCGYRLPALLQTEDAVAEVPSDYLVYLAAYQLDAAMAEGVRTDPEQHGGRALAWLREAQSIEDLMARGANWHPDTQEVQV